MIAVVVVLTVTAHTLVWNLPFSFHNYPSSFTHTLSPSSTTLLSLSSIIIFSPLQQLSHIYFFLIYQSKRQVLNLSELIVTNSRTTMEGGENCCVKVAVHVRPLIADEKLQGCKDCVAVVAGKPQVHTLSTQQRWMCKMKCIVVDSIECYRY
jgi:hypothetical protein